LIDFPSICALVGNGVVEKSMELIVLSLTGALALLLINASELH
jgi:hypothetical protein